MPNLNAYFQGYDLILPGAYESDNVTNSFANPNLVVPPLLFIGYGYGGAPHTPYQFSSVQDLQVFLRGGPCSEFLTAFATPAPGLNGAQKITYLNACESTQSSLAFAGSGGVAIMNLTSVNYGLPSNQLQLTAAPVYSGAGVNLSIYDGYSGQSVSQNNVGIPMSATWTGSTTAEISVVATSGVPTSILIIENGVTTNTLAIGAGGYTTVSQFIEYLNGIPNWSATLIGDNTLPLADLDIGNYSFAASGVSKIITASFNGPAYWVNQYASAFATAVSDYTGSPTVGGVTYLAQTNTPFTGAVSTPPVLNDYALCLNAALLVDGFSLVIDSNSSQVNALASAHVTMASSPTYGNRGRRYFTGSSIGDSVATTVAAAAALDNDLVSYVYPGISITSDITGVTTAYGGYMAAAAAAAISVGNDVALPLTAKALQAVAVEKNLQISDIDTLQQGGVMVVQNNSANIPAFVRDITTWQINNNPLNCIAQQVQMRLWLAYVLCNATRPFVGTVASPFDESNIISAAQAALNGMVRSATNQTNAVLASWDTSSLKLVYTGSDEQAAISVSVVLVGQNTFITIYVPVSTYSGTVTLSTTNAA